MTVAFCKMEIQRNGNKKHGVVRFTEVIIMSGNNNQKSAGYICKNIDWKIQYGRGYKRIG